MNAMFVLDLGRCVGCGACVVACRLEHGWPSASPRRRLVALNDVRHPGGPTYFVSLACHHCERPACVSACPSGAYKRRPDGIVMHDANRCMGCRYCEMICPFGAPRFDSSRGVVAKCDFCQPRVDSGEAPACVEACPTEALQVGETDRPMSEVRGPKPAAVQTIPGFSDPMGCRPSVRFRQPRGIRGLRLAELLKKMPSATKR